MVHGMLKFEQRVIHVEKYPLDLLENLLATIFNRHGSLHCISPHCPPAAVTGVFALIFQDAIISQYASRFAGMGQQSHEK